ncbi:toll/interleukin-1 receptor domain-containing protein [Sorangium sp. So ce367]|uniref:toll/interleukin-1 receptor domain-containing protein n=1 Tax=Sorangium sp. So ce367 TaxID=3133305 RepID=UPI003F628012
MGERRGEGGSERVTGARELLTRYAAGERAFREADLAGADLTSAELTDADLGGAVLIGADLRGANLFRADLGGANLTGANLDGAKLSQADLYAANLSAANLARADLYRATLTEATLSAANLSRADLYEAFVYGANFISATLTEAKLACAVLVCSDLTGANLTGATLAGANLHRATLNRAKLDDVVLSHTLLLDVDLTPLSTASPPAQHEGPSYVDSDSIVRSLRAPNLKEFLARAGMPEVFVEYMIDCARSLETNVFKMLQSTFISYGAPDESFARQLYEALHRNGVTTFFFPEHAEPGEKLHRMMRKGVNEHDRVILICSRHSLDRKGVLNELEEILAREARDGGASYLIPIRLDDYVFTGWKPRNADVAQAVRDRVVADFERAGTDEAKFHAGLQKLIRVLRKKTIEPGDGGKG